MELNQFIGKIYFQINFISHFQYAGGEQDNWLKLSLD